MLLGDQGKLARGAQAFPTPGISRPKGRCRAAIDVCLVFYVGGKVFFSSFLVERAHRLVATKLPRSRDLFYLLGIAIVVFGFGVLAVFGLPLVITIPLLSYDIIINFALNSVFLTRAKRRDHATDGFLQGR